MKTYFVTGATGAVGSALVPLLLSDPSTEVRLLLRAPSPEALDERLEHLFRFWEVEPGNDGFRRRVTGLRGDTTLPQFGLAEPAYRSLTEVCTHIVHAAGNVRMNLPIENARCSSVDSARHIVALARACMANGALQKVEFVSTVGIGGRIPVVPERRFTEPREFHNTYEQAKAEAEGYLYQQIDAHGLPVTVHRPSMVVGHSQTGKIIHFQIFYYLCEFLSGRQTLGLLPILEGVTLDTIPVDFVAQAVSWSSTQAHTAGRIFHLCSGPERAMGIAWLSDALRKILMTRGEELPRLHRVPLGLFRRALPLLIALADRRKGRALGNLAIFLDYARDCQRFENGETTVILSSVPIAIPAPKDYLEPVLTAYLKREKR